MMRFVQSLGIAAWALRSVAALLARPIIWVPFILVAGVQALVLILLIWFHSPALQAVGLPLVRLLGGENATHYPMLFYSLPTMFFRVNLAIAVLVTSIAGGAATLLFARGFGLDGVRTAWRDALRRAPALMIATLVMVAIIIGIAGLAGLVPREMYLNNAVVRWVTRGGTLLLFVVVQSLFAYATPWIVLRGHSAWPAIRDSVRVTGRTLLPTLVVVGVPAVLIFPLSYASGRVDLIAEKLKPEIVGGLLGMEVTAQLVLTFLLVGAVTRLFLWRMEAAR